METVLSRCLVHQIFTPFPFLTFKGVYPAIVILSTNKGDQINSVLLGHGLNIAFLVPDSCGATERNGNSIRSDATDDTIEND